VRYINGTRDYGLLYTHDHIVKLTGYHSVCGSVERITGGCSFLGKNLISWSSENLNCLNITSGKNKFTFGTWSKLSWIKQILKEFNVTQDASTLCFDCLSAVDLSKIPIQNNKSKHFGNLPN
jgi:hypothetical protein